MSVRVRNEKIFNEMCQWYDLLSTLNIDKYLHTFNEVYIADNPIPLHDVLDEDYDMILVKGNTDQSSYHEKRDEIFCKIDSLYRELTPGYGQRFLTKIGPHRSDAEIRRIDEAYLKTTRHEGKRILSKMCPQNV